MPLLTRTIDGQLVRPAVTAGLVNWWTGDVASFEELEMVHWWVGSCDLVRAESEVDGKQGWVSGWMGHQLTVEARPVDVVVAVGEEAEQQLLVVEPQYERVVASGAQLGLAAQKAAQLYVAEVVAELEPVEKREHAVVGSETGSGRWWMALGGDWCEWESVALVAVAKR
jgi:hypothetical protein